MFLFLLLVFALCIFIYITLQTDKNVVNKLNENNELDYEEDSSYEIFYVAGINFQGNLDKYLNEKWNYAALIPEPENKYDEMAILIIDPKNMRTFGHIKESQTWKARKIMGIHSQQQDFPIYPAVINIVKEYDDERNEYYYVGKLAIPYKK